MMRRALLHWLLCLGMGVPLCANSQASAVVPEYTMKAAYLYYFALLTTWPESVRSADADFFLCIFGPDEFGPALDQLNGKDVNGQKVRVWRVDAPEDALRCQLVFINDPDVHRIQRLLSVLGTSPVLTVSDDKRTRAAMINLQPQNQRLGFIIDASAARSAKLQLSSKLMRLASLVQTP